MILEFEGKKPKIGKDVFVADTARVIGEVELGDEASIWYGAILRGDIGKIVVGKRSNVQDNSILHITPPNYPVIIGDDVTVGHGVILHGCKIGSRSLIGMGAIVLDGVEIGEESIVAAGAVVPPGKKFPPRSLIMGVPAKVVREITDDDVKAILENAEEYVNLGKRHLKEYEGL